MFNSKRFKQISFILFTFFSIFSYLVAQTGSDDILGTSQSEGGGSFNVTRVVDGDTFVIETGEYVRFIGIDSPELNKKECYSVESTGYLKDRIENKQVKLVKDVNNTDRYKRLLRYVYIDDEFLNEELVNEGYAKEKAYPPDTKYQDILNDAEIRAKELNFGLWKYCY
jgi:micrococcal nuclease